MGRLWVRRLSVAAVCLLLPIGLWLIVARITSSPVDYNANQLSPTNPAAPATAQPSNVTESARRSSPSASPTPSASTPATPSASTTTATRSQRPTATATQSEASRTTQPTAAQTTAAPETATAAPTATTTTSPLPGNAPSRTPTATQTATPTPTADTSPPSKVTGLDGATEDGGYSYTFTWFPASDNVGVVGYEVEVDGTVTSTSGTSFEWSRPVDGTDNTYAQVRAFDAAGNTGSWSDQYFIPAPTPTPEPTPTSDANAPNGSVNGSNMTTAEPTGHEGQPTPP